MSNTTSGLSRRTLAKGAAWSVPVVAVAGSVPAYAASPEPEDPIHFEINNGEAGACKYPGKSNGDLVKAYRLGGFLVNSSNVDVTLTITGATGFLDNVDVEGWDYIKFESADGPSDSATVPAGDKVAVVFIVEDALDSGNKSIEGTVYFSYEGGSGSFEFYSPTTKPCPKK